MIDLIIIDFDISIDKNCEYDKFLIYDGSSVNSNVVYKFCGNNNSIDGLNFTSTSNKVLIIFESNDGTGMKGFRLQYKKVSV